MSDIIQEGMIYGITKPISFAEPIEEEIRKSIDLETHLESMGTYESDIEMLHRRDVLTKVQGLVDQWVKETVKAKILNELVGQTPGINEEEAQRTAEQQAETISGKIFVTGSYRMGAYIKGADIDLIILAPIRVTRDDFNITFADRLRAMEGNDFVRVIAGAFVPIIETMIEGIEFDFMFSRSINMETIPSNMNPLDYSVIEDMNENCKRSITSYRVVEDSLAIVPNYDSFKLVLLSLKVWAKKRCLYSNIFGYLGGAAWIVMTVRVCQLYPCASAATLLQKFFLVYSQWPWPKPLLLRNNIEERLNPETMVWDPRRFPQDQSHLMPIIYSVFPPRNVSVNITYSSRDIIKNDFAHAFEIINQIMAGKQQWSVLFQPFKFFDTYKYYLVILTNTNADWSNYVEVKAKNLVSNLDSNQSVGLSHIYPKRFTRNIEIEVDSNDPSAQRQIRRESEFMWFIGLRLNANNLDLSTQITRFLDNVRFSGGQNLIAQNNIVYVKFVRRCDLADYISAEDMQL